jgi:hypothetical protein
MASIRLETSKRTGIENAQFSDLSTFDRKWIADIPKKYPRAKPRTGPSPVYNCHGLTFASRRTRIFEGRDVQRILSDDAWLQVNDKDVLPGDIVVYVSDDGDLSHSGIVIKITELGAPLICSKWGSAGEYIHLATDTPSIYQGIKKYYRCGL